MTVIINGEPVRLAQGGEDLSALLSRLGYGGEHFAVAVNGVFVPRHQLGGRAVAADDRIEVLAPMVGG